jgi:DNA-damage-inducible protein J
MAKTDTLHIRVEPDVKANVESTLNLLGLSTTEAINIFLRQVVLTGGLPFEVKLPRPTAETLAAMEEARAISRTGKGYSSVDDLMKDLDT